MKNKKSQMIRIKNNLSFQEKLRSELLGGLKKTAFFIALSYLFVLTLFLLIMQYSQLHQSQSMIMTYFNRIDQRSDKLVEDLEKRGLSTFFKGGISERDMYRQVYEESHKIPIRTAVSIYDQHRKLKLSTKLPSRDGLADDSYVRIALKNIRQQFVYKITKDYQGNQYLLKLVPIKRGNKLEGYLVLYMDSNDFQFGITAESTQYVVADNFDNYFTSNSLKYLSDEGRKIKPDLHKDLFIREGSRFYILKKEKLTPTIVLYTYILAFPLTILLLVTLIFTSLILLILLIYSKQTADKISRHSSHSIKLLMSDLNLIMKGYKNKVNVIGEDEFGQLAQDINRMIETLERIFKQTIQLEQEKTRVERKLLEAQFNPHFLYNALESIKILVYLDPKKAEYLILALNKVLRYSISTKSDTTFLEDDLAIIEAFLSVNQVRFDELDYIVTCPKTLSKIPVPKLFLLPLVENALKYGMRDRHNLTLSIDISQKDSLVIILVTDDGAGFSEDFITNFDTYLREGLTQHGIVNSYHRLKLSYPSTQIKIIKKDYHHQLMISFERK
ncbi:sensor histidine kinase [Streptococcus parauberis]|uniref:sensor histidine kinase n=1 Tax=Streptococcus parauberis TaxID=1348 RepID=UPI000CCF5C81|nr:histidine kinase [Streptococcus parauberis]PNY20218.1 putative sensor-like histidine kinase [Streptococcus parauberis]